jgi:hypothetical protein
MSDSEKSSSSSYKSNLSDNDTVEEKKDFHVSKEFEENVIKFTQYDDLIRKRTEEIAELKKKRDPCKKYVLDYLQKINETTIEINDGKLRFNKFETKQPLTQDIIKTCITKVIDNPQTAEKIMKDMDDSRPMKERIDLKRTFERKKK